MFYRPAKIKPAINAALMLVCGLVLGSAPAQADYAPIMDMGAPVQTVRNPLLPGQAGSAPYPGAASSAPYQAAPGGQPPPLGSGAVPWPIVPGDLGAPLLPPSGTADPTTGNIFPNRIGPGTSFPGPYVPGAGRRITTNGVDQGMYDFGQGQLGGTNLINNGGYRANSTFRGPGGQEMGSNVINNGGNFGGSDWGPGGKNGGFGVMNNGGPRGNATGQGPGAQSGGTGVINNGGNFGGTGFGPGGRSNGNGTTNNGGPAGNAQGQGPGGPSNGNNVVNDGGPAANAQGHGPGGPSNGTGWMNNGGPASNAQGMGGGGPNGGTGVYDNGGGMANGTPWINDGGPAPGAQGEMDRLWPHGMQPSRYDFTGPLPTVKIFCRYLVILGVVFGTVFITLAGWSMVFGGRYAGMRVIGAAGGLILLLMGYTIWKIVQMNTFHANSTGYTNQQHPILHQRQQGPQPIVNPPGNNPQQTAPNQNLPQVPNTPPPGNAGPTFWPIFGNGPLPPKAGPTFLPQVPNTPIIPPPRVGHPGPPHIPATGNGYGPAIDNFYNPPEPGIDGPNQNHYNYTIDTPVPQANIVGGDPNGINKTGSPPNNGRLLPGQPGAPPGGTFVPFPNPFAIFGQTQTGTGVQNATGNSGGITRPHAASTSTSAQAHGISSSASHKKSGSRKDRKGDRVNRGGKIKEVSHANDGQIHVPAVKPEEHKSWFSNLFGGSK